MGDREQLLGSYAQNFEDVLFWCALKEVWDGFCTNVRAWCPDLNSVIRVFNLHDRHGINIGPLAKCDARDESIFTHHS